MPPTSRDEALIALVQHAGQLMQATAGHVRTLGQRLDALEARLGARHDDVEEELARLRDTVATVGEVGGRLSGALERAEGREHAAAATISAGKARILAGLGVATGAIVGAAGPVLAAFFRSLLELSP